MAQVTFLSGRMISEKPVVESDQVFIMISASFYHLRDDGQPPLCSVLLGDGA